MMDQSDYIKYFEILEIDEGATEKEIKTAFRNKAKILHPDRNHSATAHEEFTALLEAYEKVIELKTLSYAKKQYAQTEYSTSQNEERKVYYANMTFEEFENSALYRSMTFIERCLQFFMTGFLLLLICALVNVAFYFGSIFGIVLLIPVFFFLKPFVLSILDIELNYPLSPFRTFLKSMLNDKKIQFLLLSVFNYFVFFHILTYTLIPTNLYFIVVACISIVSYLFLLKYYKVDHAIKRKLISLAIIPMMFNSLLFINFYICGPKEIEVYEYYFKTEYHRNNRSGVLIGRRSSFIELENNLYEDYWGIRMFINPQIIGVEHKIMYEMSEGLLGIKVMKGYLFF